MRKIEKLKLEGRVYNFSAVTGVVLEGGQNKHVETHVQGSGGGGYVGSANGGGYIEPISISSHNVVNQEFWLKTDSGRELSIQLSNSDIPLRVGQKITMISAALEGSDHSFWAVLVNHNSQEHYYLSGVGRNLFKNRKFLSRGLPFLVGVVCVIYITFLEGRLKYDVAAFSFLIPWVVTSAIFSQIVSMLQKKDKNKSKAFLNKIAQEIY